MSENKKTFGWICGAMGLLWAGMVAVDVRMEMKASAATEPIKGEIQTIRDYDKLVHESIEREMIMARQYEQENNRMLKQLLYK